MWPGKCKLDMNEYDLVTLATSCRGWRGKFEIRLEHLSMNGQRSDDDSKNCIYIYKQDKKNIEYFYCELFR